MKTNFNQLRSEKQVKYNNLMDEFKVFWAFNNKQFNEGIAKCELLEGEKVVSIGAGGYIPKKNVQSFIDGQKSIEKWFKNAMKTMKEEHILYELNNHECFYTGSIESAANVLPYSKKMVLDVYRKHAANFNY